MFDVESLCAEVENAVKALENLCISNGGVGPNTLEIKAIFTVRQLVDSTCDRIASHYAGSGPWAGEGYLTGKAALVHETGLLRKHIDNSVAHGKFLRDYPTVLDALRTNTITTDHVTSMIPLATEKYYEFFNDDVDLLINTAQTVSALQFSHVVRHWKNMVDALLDEPTEEYLHFQNRKLFLNELLDGTWLIHGELDPITGKLVDKALKSVAEKLWRNASPESRNEYAPAQQRADAIGYLAQGYVSSAIFAATPEDDSFDVASDSIAPSAHNEFRDVANPALSADIIVDIDDLSSGTTTHTFLKKCIDSSSPMINTHSNKFIEQILCDSFIQVPVKNPDGTYDLGRTARTAPWKLKKQLMLNHTTCSVRGCTIPAAWCDAHHIQHWAHGGKTSMDNLALLCRRHHTIIHNDRTFEEKYASTLRRKPPPHLKTG